MRYYLFTVGKNMIVAPSANSCDKNKTGRYISVLLIGVPTNILAFPPRYV